MEQLRAFCERWRIAKLEIFGSAVRDDFDEDSDLDLLVTFDEDAHWSLLDLVRAQRELEALTGRRVDLVERRAVERSRNWIRRKAIIESAQPLYAA